MGFVTTGATKKITKLCQKEINLRDDNQHKLISHQSKKIEKLSININFRDEYGKYA